jgi:hypothetical protein
MADNKDTESLIEVQQQDGVEGAEPLINGGEGVEPPAEPLINGGEGVKPPAEPLINGGEGVEPPAEPLGMIMRQTDYNKETAQQKLTEHNNDVMEVIREYMAPVKPHKICTTKLSVNQQIYKEIRGMMDDAAKAYELKKK